ncbi:MAG: cyclic nucleotide-binding domain-containing protein [Candidatus Tectimicrobiota bacterium]
METLQPLIAAHPFFRDLEPHLLEIIVGCATNGRFAAGTFLCREGEPANQFYLIRHGKAALQIHLPERGSLTIETIEPGEVLGWSWLFPPYRWHFDVQALELTRALVFDGQCLRTKCEADHDLGYALMQRFAQVMAQRLQATRLQLLDLYGVQT